MKETLLSLPKSKQAFLLIGIVMLMNIHSAAQLPDCTSGNLMYGVFVNIAGSTTADSTEIRPISYATGAVGPLMGGKRYFIRKQIGTTWYYASSALGVNLVNNRFYLITQMSNPGAKDIIAIDPVTASMTVVGTMPVALNNYHFVKLAIAMDGNAYAIGVARDTTTAANLCNVLVRFSSCGALPTAGCATASITILGYLPTTGSMYKWKLFNGDLAFDASGNLYFATAAYDKLSGTTMAYTDARLFKIKVADLPTAAGSGIIPMNLMAEYNTLDSTVINGIALDLAGNMYISTRVFNGPQNQSGVTSSPQVFVSPVPGTANKLTGFSSPTPNFSISDLASCNFPNRVLSAIEVRLTGRSEYGKTDLKWDLNNNSDVGYFELQRSGDANEFQTIATVNPDYSSGSSARYSYSDAQVANMNHAYYRVKAVMKSGVRNYSNVASILIEDAVFMVSGPNPNPTTDHADFVLSLKEKKTIKSKIIDQSGSLVKRQDINATIGENKIRMDALAQLRPGMYIVEFSVDDQVIRSKMIKQ